MRSLMQEREGKFGNEMQRLTGALRKSSVTGISWERLGVADSSLGFEGEGKSWQVREAGTCPGSRHPNPAQSLLLLPQLALALPPRTAG